MIPWPKSHVPVGETTVLKKEPSTIPRFESTRRFLEQVTFQEPLASWYGTIRFARHPSEICFQFLEFNHLVYCFSGCLTTETNGRNVNVDFHMSMVTVRVCGIRLGARRDPVQTARICELTFESVIHSLSCLARMEPKCFDASSSLGSCSANVFNACE